ncbi:LysR family transcriptional regulator [Hydrogenophaga sp.]|uniref:LysR family transcriptional regulator n=1 Tax=Hydrogenophaga sp. TaxID=1904254 RepID=UPI003F73096D
MSETTTWTDKLKRMALFAEIVDSGSISAAARRVGSTPSALSQQLRLLEQALGLVLLNRSTRRITLTEAGERYYPACAAMVAQARSADQALERLRDEPEGELRLAAPIGFGELLATALEPLRRHPRLRLHLLLDDTRIDLLASRVDMALRTGPLPDSSQVARPLGHLPRQLCAAPRYLAERGWPQHPRDLAQHDWLGLPPRQGSAETLELTNAHGEHETVRLQARVQASQVVALQAMAEAGWGIQIAVTKDTRVAMTQGRLVPVLPGWQLAPIPVFAVTPRRDELPAKVRHALAALRAHFDADPAGISVGTPARSPAPHQSEPPPAAG